MTEVTEIQRLVAEAALAKMVSKGYFDICTIDAICKAWNQQPNAEAYALLRPLHCVEYNTMPAALRQQLPALINQALGDGVNMQAMFDDSLAGKIVVVEPDVRTAPGGFRKLLQLVKP